MKLIHVGVFLLLGSLAAQGQLTREQKIADLQTLAAQFVKRYAPYEWKRDLLKVDLMNLSPFLERAASTTNDLDFYEVCVDYVSQLQDGHVFFQVPSDFVARLNMSLDVYGDKVLIDGISRTRLPARDFPFQIGDEVVSVDGRPVAEVIQSLAKYVRTGNPRGDRRFAAAYIAIRPQALMPHAIDVGDKATLVIRRQNGDLETYDIPWTKVGTPLLAEGPVPNPKTSRRASARAVPARGLPPYLEPLGDVLYSGLPAHLRSSVSIANVQPLFALPPNFKQRLGGMSDDFLSGTYEAGGKVLGYIRIPYFDPDDPFTAISQFEREIAYFQANTDGLIVDVMHNPGGWIFYGTELVRRLIPRTFRTMGFEMRATAEIVMQFSFGYEYAKAIGAPDYVLNQIAALKRDVEAAYRANRGQTGPVPLDFIDVGPDEIPPTLDVPPAMDRTGRITAYSKPVIVLTDELSFSGADAFPATMQDNQAALIVGMRTAGAGGTNSAYDAGAYSEAYVGLTRGLMVRKNPVVTRDYPTTAYVENVGVHPDVELDYQTRENLMNRGRTFLDDMTGVAVSYILSKEGVTTGVMGVTAAK